MDCRTALLRARRGTKFSGCRSIERHRPPFTTAPVADAKPLASSSVESSNAMDDLHDLVLAMFAIVIAAIMLVAGELYLVARPDPLEPYMPPPSVEISSIN
jgi:hypothetical protein